VTPTLPISPADLSELVAEAWPDVVRTSERHPGSLSHYKPSIHDGAHIVVIWAPGETQEERADIRRALSALGDVLEDAGLIVDREAGLRVVGWAAALGLVIDLEGADRNMYGLPPCPGCGSIYMYPPNRARTGGKLKARCDDCGHEEPVGEEGTEPELVRIVGLDVTKDKRWERYFDAVREARQARAVPSCPNAKTDREGWERWRARYGRGGMR
jgi:hypothetical protein